MTFKNYVLNWFHLLVEEHCTDKGWQCGLFKQFGFDDSYIEADESVYDFLLTMSDENVIYKSLFGYGSNVNLDDIPDTESFLADMFKEVGKGSIKDYDFAEELLEDMAAQCIDYVDPTGFFQDLQQGGCASGMIGMFIYNSDCKKFYIEHIDSMEDYIGELEDSLGSSIKNDKKLPHYTFICWVCYEELAFRIASALWSDKF